MGQGQLRNDMPELPEVETIRLQLDKVLKGLKITGIEVLKKESFIGPSYAKASSGAKAMADMSAGKELIGLKVLGVKRRAKITLIELEGGIYLAIHLKMTGQLIYRGDGKEDQKNKTDQKEGPYEVRELPNKYTRVIISFDPPSSSQTRLRRASKLYFNDLRIFGWIRVVRPHFVRLSRTSQGKDIRVLEELGLEKLGPEANNEKSFNLEYFKDILGRSKKPVKLLIMDQEKIAGIGNIYANEALFKAGILPTRPASSLTGKEVVNLRNSITEVLNNAIKHKGSSDKDEAYRQITGEKGSYQNYLMVYGKKDQKCPNCSGKIKWISLGGRGTFFCENCQK